MSARELIDTGNGKRYVRRDEKGQFEKSVDVGKSLAADQRTKAKTVAKKGRAIAEIASKLSRLGHKVRSYSFHGFPNAIVTVIRWSRCLHVCQIALVCC
jgi:hypothetical protein